MARARNIVYDSEDDLPDVETAAPAKTAPAAKPTAIGRGSRQPTQPAETQAARRRKLGQTQGVAGDNPLLKPWQPGSGDETSPRQPARRAREAGRGELGARTARRAPQPRLLPGRDNEPSDEEEAAVLGDTTVDEPSEFHSCCSSFSDSDSDSDSLPPPRRLVGQRAPVAVVKKRNKSGDATSTDKGGPARRGRAKTAARHDDRGPAGNSAAPPRRVEDDDDGVAGPLSRLCL